MIDYAEFCMKSEKALKDLHYAAIEGRLEDAKKHALEAATQARLTYQALRHMQSGVAHFSDTAAPTLTEGVPSR
jgi:hypothetical protein